jgi:hypothetical protein
MGRCRRKIRIDAAPRADPHSRQSAQCQVTPRRGAKEVNENWGRGKETPGMFAALWRRIISLRPRPTAVIVSGPLMRIGVGGL